MRALRDASWPTAIYGFDAGLRPLSARTFPPGLYPRLQSWCPGRTGAHSGDSARQATRRALWERRIIRARAASLRGRYARHLRPAARQWSYRDRALPWVDPDTPAARATPARQR